MFGRLLGKLKSTEREHSCKQNNVMYCRTARKTLFSPKSPALHLLAKKKARERLSI